MRRLFSVWYVFVVRFPWFPEQNKNVSTVGRGVRPEMAKKLFCKEIWKQRCVRVQSDNPVLFSSRILQILMACCEPPTVAYWPLHHCQKMTFRDFIASSVAPSSLLCPSESHTSFWVCEKLSPYMENTDSFHLLVLIARNWIQNSCNRKLVSRFPLISRFSTN